jgi:hypothetical protein
LDHLEYFELSLQLFEQSLNLVNSRVSNSN